MSSEKETVSLSSKGLTTDIPNRGLLEGVEEGEPILEVEGITKQFPGVLANDNIDFEIKAGEIHAIVGENGAGKSTLMKILNGEYQPDGGTIRLRGEIVNFDSPADAIEKGIGMVHQHLRVIPAHTVLENMILGHPKGEGLPRMSQIRQEVEELCEEYGFSIDLDAKLWQLSAAEKQTVEILRVLYRGAELLILDEPTAALTPVEEEIFIDSIEQMSSRGLAVIPFITHKLPTVLEVSDRITVLRSGKVVDKIKTENATREDLAHSMVGESVLFDFEKSPGSPGEEILTVENLSALNDRGVKALNGVSFSVREGEILSIVGVSGNGQQELVESIMGLRELTGGKILFDGDEITHASIRDRWNKGLGYIPVDREKEGAFKKLPLYENFAMNLYWLPEFARYGFMDKDKIREETRKACEEFDVRPRDITNMAGNLSGGNLQKLIIARVLKFNPKLLIANLPTHGLDVDAGQFVGNKLLEARDNNKGVILISEDLDQALSLGDRIAPMYEGQIARILSTEQTDKQIVGRMMAGVEEE